MNILNEYFTNMYYVTKKNNERFPKLITNLSFFINLT